MCLQLVGGGVGLLSRPKHPLTSANHPTNAIALMIDRVHVQSFALNDQLRSVATGAINDSDGTANRAQFG